MVYASPAEGGAPALLRDQLSGNLLQRTFPLSKRAISGPARYRALSCYACNPLQHWWPICVRSHEIPFEIVPRPPG